MTDARTPPSCTDVAKLLERGPLLAHEISALLRCSLKQTMAAIHMCWWSIVPVAWDGPGFKYAMRDVLNKRITHSQPVKEFAGRTVKPGSYA